MSNCSGKGDCLNQIGCNPSIYEKPQTPCPYNCEPKKCPNFEVCGNIEAEWCINLKGNQACLGCWSKHFNRLEFSENEECIICNETTKCVKQLNCSHKTCITCFKRCYYGEKPPPQPEFPYSEDVYQRYENNDQEILNDPKVKQWLKDLDTWDFNECKKRRQEEYLRKCPMCRQ